jgi:hypothetical protein
MPDNEGMRKRSRTPSHRDTNELAFNIVQVAAGEKPAEGPDDHPEKNPNAVALGHLGGLKGGAARAKKLSKKRRKEIAEKAAKARWRKTGE